MGDFSYNRIQDRDRVECPNNNPSARKNVFSSMKAVCNGSYKCGIREFLELCDRFGQEIYEVSNLDALNVS